MAPVNVLKDAARVPIFWVLFGTFFVCGSSPWTDPDPFHHAMPRLWLAGGDRGERARDDGHFRLFRHHRLRLAVRPLRQSLAVVLVLRAARPFAALPTVHRFHVLRPSLFAVFYGLDWIANRTADRETDGRPLRPGEAGMVFGWVFAGTRSAPPVRRSAPVWYVRNIRLISRRSSSPVRSASSRRHLF